MRIFLWILALLSLAGGLIGALPGGPFAAYFFAAGLGSFAAFGWMAETLFQLHEGNSLLRSIDGRLKDQAPQPLPYSARKDASLIVGDLVRHPAHGEGVVFSLYGDGEVGVRFSKGESRMRPNEVARL